MSWQFLAGFLTGWFTLILLSLIFFIMGGHE